MHATRFSYREPAGSMSGSLVKKSTCPNGAKQTFAPAIAFARTLVRWRPDLNDGEAKVGVGRNSAGGGARKA